MFGGTGYAIGQAYGSSENLIENGIAVEANKVIVGLQSGAGSVAAYNFMDQAKICALAPTPRAATTVGSRTG